MKVKNISYSPLQKGQKKQQKQQQENNKKNKKKQKKNKNLDFNILTISKQQLLS